MSVTPPTPAGPSGLPLKTLNRLAGALAPPQLPDQINRRWGQIAAIHPGDPPTVDVVLNGTTIPNARFLLNYRPLVGDVVILDHVNYDPLVLGTLNSAAAPAGSATGRIVQDQLLAAIIGSSFSSSSTSYVGLVGPFSFTKLYQVTKLRVHVEGSFYLSAIGGITVGVGIGGANTDLGVRFTNEASSHKSYAFTGDVLSVAPGAYTIQSVVKVNGAYTVSCDSNDFVGLRVTEVF